jgi:type I restriction enzyme S subunit
MQMNQINTDTHKRYWISIYAEHDLLVPPLLEQKAIVAKIEQLFSELDNGIENLKTAQAKLKIYRQAVLQKAFDGELTNIQTIKWIEIKDIVKNVEYGTSSKSLEMGTVPVLRMGNIQNGKFDWNDLKYSNDEEEISKYHLNLNDVLFNRTNSPEHVGKTAIFKSDKKAIFAGYLIRINYLKDKINGDYLTYYLNSHTAKQYGNKIKSFGVNQSNINGTKLKTYPFPLCSLVEQSKIVQEIESRLSVCDKIEETISNSLVKAEALRQSILKKAFEGNLLNAKELETIHAHPDYESAEELLKRIKQERVK